MSSASKSGDLDPLTYRQNSQLRWEICWMARADPENRFNIGSDKALRRRQLIPVAKILARDIVKEIHRELSKRV